MAESIVSGVFHELERLVQAALVHIGLDGERNHVKLIKKTRDLKCGDVFIPTGIMKLDNTKSAEILGYLEQSTEELKKKFVRKVFTDKFSILTFHLDRVQFCRAVFKEIQDNADRYGHAKVKINHSVYINSVNKESTHSKNSLTDLRLEVIKYHMEKLLDANGYLVISQTKHSDNIGLVLGTTKLVNTDNSCEQLVSPQTSELEKCFMEKARLLALSNSPHDQQQKQYFQVVCDGKPTYIMQEVARLAECIQSKECCHCLHVVPYNQVFTQQRIQFTLAALSDQMHKQSMLVVGPVVAKHTESTDSKLCLDTAEAFYEKRFQQMKDASEIRNGCDSSDHRQVEVLTSASIKLDLLGNTSQNSLHLDTSSTDCGADSRIGAFVLYNAARLATLMSRYAQAVQEGMYPPLPPLEDIDFSLLREEEDWELVYLYLAAFPDVVRQSVESLFPKDGKNMAKIHTHKVTSFIIALTKCVSAHYSRYHVLTGGEPHLLPLMYARLYLLKSVHQVLLNSLQLVGVEALSFL